MSVRLCEISPLRERADTYCDQELAKLFGDCGWTQERIAAKVGKRQSWVSVRLIFGRFLEFITSGDNRPADLAQLTDRTLRRHFARKGGRPKNGEKGSDTTFIGRGAADLLARLDRDHPNIAAAYCNGIRWWRT